MIKIQIKRGIYGHRPQDKKSLTPVYPGGICDVSGEEAARLVSLGIADYISENSAPEAAPGKGPEYAADEEGVQLMDMTRAELEQLAEDMGVNIRKCRNKGEIIEALEAAGADSEDTPELSAEGPVV